MTTAKDFENLRTIDEFDIQVTMWQRIHLAEPMPVSEVRKLVDAKNINSLFDDIGDIHGNSFENMVDSEEYDYATAEYYKDGEGNPIPFNAPQDARDSGR